MDGAWEGGLVSRVVSRGGRRGVPVWPVSFVTRRLGKVITCLGGEGGGKMMELGGKYSALAPVVQQRVHYELRFAEVWFEILALN